MNGAAGSFHDPETCSPENNLIIYINLWNISLFCPNTKEPLEAFSSFHSHSLRNSCFCFGTTERDSFQRTHTVHFSCILFLIHKCQKEVSLWCTISLYTVYTFQITLWNPLYFTFCLLPLQWTGAPYVRSLCLMTVYCERIWYIWCNIINSGRLTPTLPTFMLHCFIVYLLYCLRFTDLSHYCYCVVYLLHCFCHLLYFARCWLPHTYGYNT